MTTKEKIEQFQVRVWDAKEDLEKELGKVFPIGAEVTFLIQRRQTSPSVGIVQAIREGHVVIKMHKLNARGRQTVKSVYWRSMIFPN